MPENMFSLSGGQTNPPPALPNLGDLGRGAGTALPEPTNLDASPMMDRWAQIQNLRNQNALFQQTFAARQRSGEILAASPDTETAIKNLLQDPIAAPFAGETINTLRQAELSLVEMQGKIGEQSSSGLTAFFKMMPTLVADPSQWDTLTKAELATMSPMARANVAPALDSLKTSIFGDLPKDPQQARTVATQRLLGYSLAAGFPPDSVKGLIGTPYQINQGNKIGAGVQLPPQFGGGLMPAQIGESSLPLTAAPERKTLKIGAEGKEQTFTINGNEATPVTQGGGASVPVESNSLAPASSAPPGRAQRDAAVNATLHDGDAPGSFAANQQPLTGPSQVDTAANEASGKVVGDITSDMVSDAKEIPHYAKRFDMMTQALGKFESGGLAETRGGLAKFMQGLRDMGFTGITQKDIDKVGNASLADTQVFNANVKPLMIEELKAAAQGTGRVMRTEVDQFLARISTETDPRAIVRLLNQDRYNIQLAYAQSKAWPKFRDGVQGGKINAKLTDFYQWFNEHQNMLDLPTKTGGGLNIGPTKEEPAGITHKWVPGKGLVPVGG